MKQFENLTIGTFGWQHENWRASYYPDDMPEDWELAYYSNFSKLVVLPMSVWFGEWTFSEPDVFAKKLDAFLDELHSESYVYVQLDAKIAKDSEFLRWLESQPEWLNGIVVVEEDVAKTQEVVQFIHQFQQAFPFLFVSGVVPDSKVEEECFAGVWNMAFDKVKCFGAPIAWIESLPSEGKTQVVVLKSFVQSLPAGVLGAPVVVAGESIAMADVQNLKVVSELLGF